MAWCERTRAVASVSRTSSPRSLETGDPRSGMLSRNDRISASLSLAAPTRPPTLSAPGKEEEVIAPSCAVVRAGQTSMTRAGSNSVRVHSRNARASPLSHHWAHNHSEITIKNFHLLWCSSGNSRCNSPSGGEPSARGVRGWLPPPALPARSYLGAALARARTTMSGWPSV